MQHQLIPENIAIFDSERKYRYLLTRKIGGWETVCTFIMLNPSTADETANDPTVSRCISYAKRWGYGTLNVLNIFALRSTDPQQLYEAEDPVGPENDTYILGTVWESDLVVAAWGVHAALKDRGKWVEKLVDGVKPLHCLEQTKEGYPKHPLYIAGDKVPYIYRGSGKRSVVGRG